MDNLEAANRHIALFLPALNDGGAERVFSLLAWSLIAQGYRVDMVLMKKEGPFLRAMPEEVNVIELGPGVLKSVIAFRNYVRSKKPDTVISGLPAPAIISLLSRKIFGLPLKIIATQHHPFSLNAAALRSLRRQLRNQIAKLALPMADTIVCVSKGVADDLLRSIPKVDAARINVIHNPVSIRDIQNQAAEESDHAWLDEDKDKPVLLSIGRLQSPKDHASVIRALADIEDVRLIILGEGPQRPELEEIVQQLELEDRVDLPGFVSNPFAYLRRADICILSSFHEGFGNVLVESMVLGTPVIASDCPYGPAEILNNGEIGRLVQPGSPEEMKQAIIDTLEQPVLSGAMLQQKAQGYDIAHIMLRYEQLLVP